MKKGNALVSKISPGFLLALILIAAVFLRFYRLDYQSLWNDEISSLRESNYPTIKEVFDYGIIPDTHPPVFQVLIWFVIRVFGNSEVVLRTPSAICGVFSVLGIYLIGKELYSYKEGLIGSAIMAVSWVQVYYSQEARSGMLMVFVSTFSALYWLKILEKMHKNERIHFKAVFPYLFFAVLSCYVHYFCVLFTAMQAVLSFLSFRDNRKKLRQLLILYSVIGFCYLPWLPGLISQVKYSQGLVSWIDVPGITAFAKFWIYVFEENIIFAGFIAIIILIYFFFEYKSRKISALFRKDMEAKYPVEPDLLLIYWFALPLVIVFVVSITVRPLFVYRYFLFTLPAIYLILAHSIVAAQFKGIIKALIGIFTILFILYSLLFSRDYYSRITKEPFREAVQFVINSIPENSILITNARPVALEYYLEKFDSDLVVDLRVNAPRSDAHLVQVNDLVNEKGSMNVLYVKEFIGGHNDPDLESQLSEEMELIEKKIFAPDYYRHRIEVYLFKID